jgi:transcriptional regulator with XRE-family HTH domain
MKNRTAKLNGNNLAGFAKRLKVLRVSKELSQAELGEIAQTNVNQISRYERAAVAPTADILFRLATALGVPVGELMDETVSETKPVLEDEEIRDRLRQIESLPPEEKTVVKKLLDAFLTSYRVKQVAAQAS